MKINEDQHMRTSKSYLLQQGSEPLSLAFWQRCKDRREMRKFHSRKKGKVSGMFDGGLLARESCNILTRNEHFM